MMSDKYKKSGDELNMALSQKVGDELNIERRIPSGYWEGDKHIRTFNHPDFARDMNNAWVLVMAMRGKGFKFQMYSKIIAGWEVTFYKNGYYTEVHKSTSLDPPTAILIAAAKALGVYDD